MSFKGKTYSKKGSGGSKTGNPFERMMKEQCNKPVAAKSAGIVGKWGATSFTSVRTNAEQNNGAPKVKKFFKSRTEKSASSSDEPSVAAVATVAAARIISPPEKQSSSKKIFRSKNIPVPPVPEAPVPPRASRSRAPERSPLQDKDWPPAPADVTEEEEEPIKKLPVPRTRKTRQNQVPEENPEDKASRLLALFNSQSKENHPSEGSKSRVSRSAKSEKISHPKESHKRKASESLEADNKLPIPKLKISLKSSAISDDYKVVKHDVNNSESDHSNGWSLDKHHQNIIAQSDLELLEGDFVSEPEPPPAPRTRRRSPLSPPHKQPRSQCDDADPSPPSAPEARPLSSQNETDDMFNLLLQTRPKRGKTKGSEPVHKTVPLPPSQNEDPFEQLMSVKTSSNSDLVKDSTRNAVRNTRQLKKESAPPPVVNNAVCDEYEDQPMPQRVPEKPLIPEYTPVSNESKPVKKTFFKSRNKVMHEKPKSISPTPVSSVDAFSMDFDRVPPIPNVLEPTPPSSQSQDSSKPSVSKSRNKFFKSKNKTSSQNDLSAQNSTSSIDLYPSSQNSVKSSLSSTQSLRSTAPSSLLSRETSLSSIVTMPSSPPPFRSPSPDTSIQFPARIATPVKTDKPAYPVKKSIFKHKAKESKDAKVLPKKAMSLYKHKMGWGGDKNEFRDREAELDRDDDKFEGGDSGGGEYDDFDFESEPVISDKETDISFAPGKLTRVATYPMGSTSLDHDTGELVTQVKCPKSYKEYFTVIKNVKSAHEMNDIGEFQEFNDDVEYICDGMKPRNKISARCLAAISLAQKCMKPNFRMHLRAHGEVSKFFGELKDAPSNSSLALCTSTILFVLSQDRLNMDMDRESLELLLNLLDTDCNIKDAMDDSGMDKRELAKNKQKVIDICTEMKSKGHAGTLNLEMISADHLAMETLLSMTSKRAGEWFKEELRELGGLAHLARTFTDCVSYLTIKDIKSWSDQLVEKLKKANRILRVLENVSHENEENCNYLIQYGRAVETSEREFVEILQKLFKLLDEEVQLNPTTDMADKEDVGVILRDTLFSVMRVHINLVHDYQNKAYGSLEVGQQEGCMYRVLRCIFIMPYWFCPLSKRFEALVLSLTLLINMVEHSEENRQTLMDSMAAQKDSDFCVKEEPRMAVEDLVQLFVDRDTLAKMSEEKTDNILDDVDEEVQEIDPKEDPNKKSDKPTLDETVQKLIGKAGNHMESTLIAAYVGLVIGYLINNNEDYECRIREYLPTRDFKSVVSVLEKMLNFMRMTSVGTLGSNKGIKATENIIKHLEKVDAEPEPEEDDYENHSSDFTLFDVTKDDTTLIDNSSQNFSATTYSFDDWGKL